MKQDGSTDARPLRIGVLGGTFNPIHNAHLQMARIARDNASLDRVLMMVAADPPHKHVSGAVGASERFAMTQLACAGETRIEGCDLELLREGKSYTRDTLLELSKQYPDAALFLILGSDMLCDLPTWYHIDEVLRMADVLSVARRGQSDGDAAAAQALTKRYGARITFLNGDADEISSTMVRDRLFSALPVSGLLPEAVERACYESGLYFPVEIQTLMERLRGALTQKRFRHTAGTMRAAAGLAQLWGQDPERARLAALLHDCAKCMDPAEQARLSSEDGGVEAVRHAFAGAVLARTLYGVTDAQVLEAIRLHTTGDAGMTDLDALIYAADIIEPNRTFDGVEAYRARVCKGPDGFMLYALRRTTELIEGTGRTLHPATVRALAYYEAKASEQTQDGKEKTSNQTTEGRN